MKSLYLLLTGLFFAVTTYGQMNTYGTTTGTCDCYQLTDELTFEAGSIWSPNSIDLGNSFDFIFDVNLGDIDAGGADGIVFVIRRLPGDPGGGGGGLGYDGILSSIGVEVDTWNNAENGDLEEDHVGMHSDGMVMHDLVGAISLGGNVEDGLNHVFRVTWDPVSFDLEIFFDGTSIFIYTGDMTTLFFDGDSNVYFGWTAGTGGSWNIQTVCSYREVDFTTDHTVDGFTTACSGEEIQFLDNSTSDLIYNGIDIIEWEWDFGDGGTSTDENPFHSFDAEGTYTVTLLVKDITGCFSEFSIMVTISGISLDVLVNEPTCYGFSDGSLVVNIPDVLEDPTFTITNEAGELINEDNSNAANELPTGWYYFTVEDESGCGSAIDSVFIGEPDQMDAEITVSDPPCHGDETGWARIDNVFNATGSIDAISYFWAPNSAGVEGVGADSTWALGAGGYTVTINDENGCSMVLDFEVNEPDSMQFSEFGFEHAYCRLYEYQSGNGVVFGAASGGTPDYNYIWTNLDNGETSISTTWGGLNPGNYELTMTDENGCVLKQSLFLDSLNPIAAFTVESDLLNDDCQGTADSSIQVNFINNSENYANPNNPSADTTFFWNLDSPNADWQITHNYFEVFDTTYESRGTSYELEACLVVINKNGCKDTACKIITIYEPLIAGGGNIFTPNGDGINDEFTFKYISKSVAEFYCVIVNRWGITVGELNDIDDGWDGTDMNGDPCKEGVYFYVYKGVSDNSTTIEGQGTVQIVNGN
ncbi:MAG: gliding motility-associated C-terminal domain-containing protein [Crocinitomix sp.]|nr:gliding motility-associated C-terminal domain-containing protein [Crocinitomix sp.]